MGRLCIRHLPRDQVEKLASKLAPKDRVDRMFSLYQGAVARHAQSGAPVSRFSPSEAGWATVCYALVRHPEFHLY